MAVQQGSFTTMIRRLFAGFICLFPFLGAAFAAGAVPPNSFSAALRETSIGANPVQAYFLVRMLRETGGSDEEVEALRRELLHSYAEQVRGLAIAQTPKDNSVAAAIARGKSRPSVPDPEFVAAWQTAFDKALGVHWSETEGPAPYFTVVNRAMMPVAPGLWAAESSAGQTYFMLALRLVNKSTLPLPIQRPDMVWGGEAGTGRGGLSFTCDWDEAPPVGRSKAEEVFMLEPGGETRPMFCETVPVNDYWKQRLPSLMAAAQSGGEQPHILSHEFDNRKRLSNLEWALDGVATQSVDWRKHYQVSQQEVGRSWMAGESPLSAPIARKWTWSPNEGWTAAGKKLKWYLGATLVALALFGGGRALLRAGIPEIAVGIGTMGTLGALLAFGMSRLGLTGGTGYDSPLFTGIALYAVIIGPMGFGIWAMYRLHRLLDAEDLTWWQTVTRGWRRAADVHSPASRAEFWGFFAQLAWWWGLFNVCLKPLHLWLGGILLYPLLTLVVRRIRSMTGAELLGVAITVVCLVLLVLA